MNRMSPPLSLGDLGSPSCPRERLVVLEAKGWDMRARRRRAKTAVQSTERYLRGLESAGFGALLYGPEGSIRREPFARSCAEETRRVSVLVVPLDGWRLDLSVYVRRIMTAAERDLGCTLGWAAVNHPDPHPHAHVILRGVSAAGHELPGDEDLVRAMRTHAEQIGPEGPSLRDNHVESRWAEIFEAQFTPWDFRLAELASGDRVALPCGSGHSDLKTRLEALEMMGLVELSLVEPQFVWQLAKGWLELLLDWGEHEDSGDLTRVFAQARDVLPWRATVSRTPERPRSAESNREPPPSQRSPRRSR